MINILAGIERNRITERPEAGLQRGKAKFKKIEESQIKDSGPKKPLTQIVYSTVGKYGPAEI